MAALPTPRPAIFVSYSHQDGGLVGPVVALLRASEALVFRDVDRLRPGKKWRQQLETAVSDSTVIVVFWCSHSCSSEEVKKEYIAAIELQKDVLPLLIDDTPLPPELAAYQYIDFRAAFLHGQTAELQPPAPPASPVPNRLRWILPSLGILLILVVVGRYWTLNLPVHAPAPDTAETPVPVPPPMPDPGMKESEIWGSAPWLLAIFIVAFAGILVARKLKSRRKAQGSEASPSGEALVTEQQVELAAIIENEILKRVGRTNEA